MLSLKKINEHNGLLNHAQLLLKIKMNKRKKYVYKFKHV